MSGHLRIFVLLVGFGSIVTGLACQSYSGGLQQSVKRADETSALGALHTISVAQRTYSVSHEGNYGTFAQLVQGGYLDSRFDSDKPNVRGYILSMTVSGAEAYSCSADPESTGPQAGGRHFFVDSGTGQIHVNATQAASANDPTLDQ
jgi:hypothetical protein